MVLTKETVRRRLGDSSTQKQPGASGLEDEFRGCFQDKLMRLPADTRNPPQGRCDIPDLYSVYMRGRYSGLIDSLDDTFILHLPEEGNENAFDFFEPDKRFWRLYGGGRSMSLDLGDRMKLVIKGGNLLDSVVRDDFGITGGLKSEHATDEFTTALDRRILPCLYWADQPTAPYLLC